MSKSASTRHVSRRIGLASAAWAFLFLAAQGAAQVEDHARWAHALDLLLDTSPSGANVGETLSGFPVLVRLTSNEIPFQDSHGRGRDLRFLDASGKSLPYQIDHWDSAGGKAAVWVKVDRIEGNKVGQAIRMLWGNPEAGDPGLAGAVFPASAGWVGVWHLGGAGKDARPNAVANGIAGRTANYDGDEGRPGLIGPCDSLDGKVAGDHLSIGDGYEDFTAGLTFSAWSYPTAVKNWARLLDMGNGPSKDNVVVGRNGNGQGTNFHVSTPAGYSSVTSDGFVLNQWQHIAVTFAKGRARTYRNGKLIREETGWPELPKVKRNENFLGRSNWTADEYYQGKIDEAVLARAERSEGWIRLSYENQKPSQSLVTFRRITGCRSIFSMPADMEAKEGEGFQLKASAECATRVTWAVEAGPAPRILDPETKVLSALAPRVAGDTVLLYRFSAEYPDGARSSLVKVRVKEAIPEPHFAWPETLAWSGSTPLTLKPEVEFLDAIKASRDSVLRYAWTLLPPEARVDTAWKADALILLSAAAKEPFSVKLCLDNGWTPVCRTAAVRFGNAVSSRETVAPMLSKPAGYPMRFDAAGRRHHAPWSSRRPASPVFTGL